jgi:serine/threonine protein kinase
LIDFPGYDDRSDFDVLFKEGKFECAISDFGLVDNKPKGEDQFTSLRGNEFFQAPEMQKQNSNLDCSKIDVWSFAGLILYMLERIKFG